MTNFHRIYPFKLNAVSNFFTSIVIYLTHYVGVLVNFVTLLTKSGDNIAWRKPNADRLKESQLDCFSLFCKQP